MSGSAAGKRLFPLWLPGLVALLFGAAFWVLHQRGAHRLQPAEVVLQPGGLALLRAELAARQGPAPRLRLALARGMKLQCDATVQYALKKHKPRLLYKDLLTPSPYNTYLHAGLPPGPICSPGLPSLMAALRPARHDYLFYVARGGGYHQFTRTYQEHLRAIERIRGGRRGQYR